MNPLEADALFYRRRPPEQRKGHWMQTFTGRVYWPIDPRPEEVFVEDIGHHLSMMCRYTGATREFYSIAEHSYHISFMVPQEDALAGLHHDDPEAYTNDINRPLKHSPGMEGYRVIEHLNHLAIFQRLGLFPDLPASVKLADAHILFHERAALLNPLKSDRDDWGMGLPRPEHVRPDMIQCWSPKEAERRFLERHMELTK